MTPLARRRSQFRVLILLCILSWCLIGAAVFAQGKTVYRCGNTYQDFPCPGARVVDLTWTPATAEDRMAAEMLKFGSPLYLPSYGGGSAANIGPRSSLDRYFEYAPRHHGWRR